MLSSYLKAIMSGSARHARLVVLVSVVLTAIAAAFAATHFDMTTDTSDLIAPTVGWRQDSAALSAAFPKQDGDLVIVVDGQTPELASDAAAQLASALATDQVHFVSASQSEGGDFFKRQGLLFGSLDDVRAQTGRLVAAQPDQIGTIIFDAPSLELFMPSLFPAIPAASIGELAQKLTLDPKALKATVATFNAAVRPGTFNHLDLDDCHTEGLTPPKSHWARRIETAPFYAYPVRPGITFTYLGTRVNREARMLMSDGGASDNMFAAGEIMAGNVLGQGYAAGIGMTLGSVFGRIAGREAAKRARH